MSAIDLDPLSVDRLFGVDTGHVPVRLRQLERPRMLWLNRRVMRHDPQFAALASEQEYEQHLLRSCSFTLVDEREAPAVSAVEVTAIADRYGGTGIGRNGGSGRAVFVNGYHVKGVGRTPLVSVLTDRAHASGGAYLEECAREAIFAEVVSAEFPFGAVPVLAIIETGSVQVWDTDAGPKSERRCLLVRPAFIRPAHFVRATEFISACAWEGSLDAQRVARTAKAACEHFGRDSFGAVWRGFWLRWAQQLAYGYVHRLSHGGHTESNIALDGRLLDFGATTALPSWARISTVHGGAPTGMDMLFLAQAIQAAAPFLARYIDESMASPQTLGAILSQANDRYRQTVMCEMLRMLGLTRPQAARLLQSALAGPIAAAASRLLTHFAREQFSMLDGMPQPRVRWDLDRFWSAHTPVHARELRALLDGAMAQALLSDQPGECTLQSIKARASLRTSTREGLFRDRVKSELYAALDGAFVNDRLTATEVGRVIDAWVMRHRRDSAIEPEAALPIGFARSSDAGYMLFVSQTDGRPFALREWHAGSTDPWDASPVAIARMEVGRVEFADTNGTLANAFLSNATETTESIAG
jgi:hypothetical protein